MCKTYENHFVEFLDERKLHGDKIKNVNWDKIKNNVEKQNTNKKVHRALFREVSNSLQRNLERAKYVSKQIEAQKRYVRYRSLNKFR